MSSSTYRKLPKILAAGLAIGCAGGYYAYKNSNKPPGLNPEIYAPFTVNKITELTSDASLFSLVPQSPSEHLTTLEPIAKVTIRDPSMQVQRPYTPLYLDANELKFFIRKYEEGPVSSYIHSKKEGDTIELRGPFKTTKLDCTKYPRIVAIVAGTGIAPIYQLAQSVKSPVDIVYCSRPGQPPLLKEELEKECPNVRVKSVQNRLVNIHDILDWDNVTVPLKDTLCIVCGSQKFVSTIAGPKADYGARQGEVKGLLSNNPFGKVWKL
ncbi:NADH-cytochrome reductase [Schizosaccharomyces pombe]|uniref:Uncharacterized FAD-binding protein C17H9.12c n=1 Tax=Schizosaccharomyces pombe (strain 972 / ATCC 24843) TaxID=284812 RepID=YE0C_SCHPO|nr:putative cytochrome c-heme-linkage protein Cyc2 [Schizosaccharomyces pombe]O13809.1 RecName: Full=Uncharacterized FAD-binding protein C17H9.12c [Schizosaccharomyces pombe 972h-]CAB11221.1 mitochondrial cytochrome c-heme linkage protein Cyc2 (predicted) [Schizosaccharomyces pombe]|eukprot:NP_593582.1 putative cytochrome c-heme-linkage protein Cyc2 [Schizosaccharomyces pombe]